MSTIRSHLSVQRHPNLIFWLCFLLLNSLLFLPLYILNIDNATLFPRDPAPTSTLAGWIRNLVLWRDNYDIFRLNTEFVLLVSGWVFIRWIRVPATRVLMVVAYALGLAYYIYEAITISFFQADPVFYVHYTFFADGTLFLLEHLNLSVLVYAGALIALVAAVGLIFILARTLFSPRTAAGLNRASKSLLAALLAAVLISAVYYRDVTANPKMAVSSLAFKVHKNVDASLAIHHDVIAFDDTPIRAIYDYSAYPLRETPSIYLIFVESYGSVLYKRSDFKAAYARLLGTLEDELDRAGWHATSALSEAPTWGGGSWMSYTSALFGYRIDSHPQFLALFNKYQIDDYPDLGRYLQSQGYEYVRLSSMSVELKEEEWLRYRNFYGADRWLRNRDLGYIGPGYGWGPSPPDQFALGYAQDVIEQEIEKPLFFFYITQNSHYPWDPMPALVDDWRQLNQPGPEPVAMSQELIAHETRRRNYLNAVEYQLRFLTEHIIESGDDNSIYVLVGDHQPPRVSRRSDGWDTPVHIIARDPALIQSFEEYGFNPGLQSRSEKAVMRHEGMYSMLVRALVANYGEDATALPEYLPDGVIVGERIAAR